MTAANSRSARIMIVDDTPANLKLLDALLTGQDYRVFAFPDPQLALDAVIQVMPDLILLDINMPQIDGYTVCETLKANDRLRDIPVIFISALNEPMDKVRAFDVGGVDYVNKPFQIEEVLARVETHIKIHRLQQQLEEYNHELEERVQAQVKEIADSQLATIIALAKLAESRDDDTGHHLERVQAYARALIRQLQSSSRYPALNDERYVQNIYHACSLHDIGKVGIPDCVLLKPGKLTEEQFEIMKTHTTIGSNTLKSVYDKYPGNRFIDIGIAVALSHHERWDGTGYPQGLSGAGIPLSARIMSIVDVYDALRSERPYKQPMSHQEAADIIVQSSGSHFDPAIVHAFMEIADDFDMIFSRYNNSEPSNLHR